MDAVAGERALQFAAIAEIDRYFRNRPDRLPMENEPIAERALTSLLAYSVVRKNRLLAQLNSSVRLPISRSDRIGLPVAFDSALAFSKSVYQNNCEA